MANTFSGMSFVNIAQRGISLFNKRLINLGIFTRDFSDEVKKQGEYVSTRIVPASSDPVAKSTTAYNDATIIVGETTTEVKPQLSRHYVVGFELTVAEMQKIGAGVLQDTKDRIIEKKINSLADEMLTYCFGLFKAASYTNSIAVGEAVAFDRENVVDIRTTLAKAHFPIPDTNLILNPDYIGGLMKDSTVSDLGGSGLHVVTDGAGAMVRMGGMPLYEAVTLPTNSENLVGLACTPDCMAVAMRAVDPSSTDGGMPAGARYEVLSDPQTGAVIGYYAWFDYAYKRWIHNFEVLYGAVKANTAACYRLKSA